jgi:hypothetical protein
MVMFRPAPTTQLEFCPPDPNYWNSLYCASGLNLHANAGWREVHAPRQCWGSVAYLVTPQLLSRFLASPPYPTWRDGTDRAAGQWCRQNGVRYLVHSPSFAQHVGAVSSLDQPGGTAENRQCNNWVSKIVFGKSPGGQDAWGFLVTGAAAKVDIQLCEIGPATNAGPAGNVRIAE